ncbi:ATP synthase mitochondrial F1 complex assembly factor 1 isoform X1 [Ambystoma mexicanum]|uniref:ATP synthase mitochondrial F1 complex assembly factor 1 isoform X1 n=1 Tax=Ambystoma mexicanum TaxID=8296 RepID=UPI0037E6F950
MWLGGNGEMTAAVLQMSCAYRGLLAVRNRALRSLPGVVGPGVRAFSVRPESPLEDNPFYGKYQEKIQRLRSSKPDVFDARMEKRSEVKNQPLGYTTQGEFIRSMEEKSLSGILNIGMVKDKTADEIREIWKQYFSMKDTVFAVIPGASFDVLRNRARACPSFLYALPRREGYEFYMGQWSGTELHFTTLINVQTIGESAPSQMVLYHYCELQEEKGIVLMTAEIDTTFLNVTEAQCLANQVQLFYATNSAETFKLVETFNHSPNNFKYMSVIAELEQSGLGSELRIQQGHNKQGPQP